MCVACVDLGCVTCSHFGTIYTSRNCCSYYLQISLALVCCYYSLWYFLSFHDFLKCLDIRLGIFEKLLKSIFTCFQNSERISVTVPESAVATPARGSGSAVGSSKMKTDVKLTTAAGLKTSAATSSLSTAPHPVPAPAVTAVTSNVRSRDPRLASRQLQSIAVSENNTAQSQDEDMQESDSVFEPVKLETAKPKPQITINLGCANKGIMNKETRGISKKDPRLLSNKVHGLSNSNVKGRTSATSSGVCGKGGGKLSGRGPSPSPSSPSRPSSSGGGKTTSPSSSSQRKTQNKGGGNGNTKPPRNKLLPKIIKIDLTDSPPPKTGDTKEENVRNKESTEFGSKSSPPSSKTDSHKKKFSPVATSRSSSERKKGLGKPGSESAGMGRNSNSSNNKRERAKSPVGGEKSRGRDRDRSSSTKYDIFVEPEGDSPSPPPPPVISTDGKQREESSKGSVFKDVKLPKGRNYVRRNLAAKSRSPEIGSVAATGDVDLRLGAPPEKHPRLNVFQPDMNSSLVSTEEDVKSKLTEFQSSCLVTGFLCFGGGCFFGIFTLYYVNTSLLSYFIFII